MEKRRLGNSDLEITRLGVGAWAIGGGDWAFGWGPQEDSESIAAIRAAVDAGMNWIDTAAVYGLGHSEEVVAKAVEGMSNPPYVFTKCERVWDENRQIGKCLKRDSIRRECEASLRRLRRDVLDLYQIHWPEPDEDIEEGWTTLAELQQEGKVRWIGVSNFDVSQLKRAQAIAPITSLQPPYSMLVRGIEAEILPYCGQNGIGIVCYSPMRNGMLSGKMTRERVENLPAEDWRRRNPDFQEPKLTANLRIADRLVELGKRYGASAGQMAIAWTLRNPTVTGAITGVRNPEQVREITNAGIPTLREEDLMAIEAELQAAQAAQAV